MRGRRGILIGGMVIGLLMGCNNGLAEELEKKGSFYESVVKIGHEFQEIFGIFGNAFGDKLGLTAVKSGDKKSAVGEHFNKVKKGLEDTKNKLEGLSGKISEAKNADGSTIEAVKVSIKGATDFFDKLISALTKLVGVTNENVDIGDTASGKTSAPAVKAEVGVVIAEVSKILEVAKESGIEIQPGNPGGEVDNANGTKALIHNGDPSAGAGPKLADKVSKADPWAMIDKIKSSKNVTAPTFKASTNYGAGELATGAATDQAAGANSIADLAAAVALKSMTKGDGKLAANGSNNEPDAVKAAGVSAVNKVLGVLDLIIRKTVEINLEKIRKAVEGINYSDTNGEATEAKK